MAAGFNPLDLARKYEMREGQIADAERLVVKVLGAIPQPYDEEITEVVFMKIKRDSDFLAEYYRILRGRTKKLMSWVIPHFVAIHTNRVPRKTASGKNVEKGISESGLIEKYTKLYPRR